MDCVETICLYLKQYISDEQFENIFCGHMDAFQNSMEEDIYLDILFTNFRRKEEKISLVTELRDYILKNHKLLYEKINDACVECMIRSDRDDATVKVLKKKYEKKKVVDIDCSTISTRLEFIVSIKRALGYPQFCGDNWDAVEDLMYDVIFPEKLIFHNWSQVEKKLPKDTTILKTILEKNSSDRCDVIYA